MAQISYIFSGVSAASNARWLANVVNNKSYDAKAYAAKVGLLRHEVYIFGDDKHVSVIKGVVDKYMSEFNDSQVYTESYHVERDVNLDVLKRYIALYFGDDQVNKVKRPWFGDVKFEAQGSRSAHRAFQSYFVEVTV